MVVVITKAQLAEMAGINTETLRTYIHSGQLYEKLCEETDYKKTQKILKPDQLKIILDHLLIDINGYGENEEKNYNPLTNPQELTAEKVFITTVFRQIFTHYTILKDIAKSVIHEIENEN